MKNLKRTTSSLKIVAGTTARADDDPNDPIYLTLNQCDPALRAIDEHRKRAKIWNEAVEIQCASEKKVTNAAYDRLAETTSEATDDLFSVARPLVTTQPTTVLGAIALLQYLVTRFDEHGDDPSMPERIDGEHWPVVAFRTLASALARMQS
jgi:hypothetical protein